MGKIVMSKRIFFTILIIFCVHTSYAEPTVDSYQTTNIINVDEELIARESTTIIDICSKEANEATKKIFKNFEQDQYSKNPAYKIDNATTCFWYYNFLASFNNKVKPALAEEIENKTLFLAEYARIAYAVTNYARNFILIHMSDAKKLDDIKKKYLEKYKGQNGPSFEYLLKYQEELQKKVFEDKHPGQPFEDGNNFDSDKAYNAIIEAVTETDWVMDISMKCYNFLKNSWRNSLGDHLISRIDLQ